jgi:hypothetical protein
MKRSFALATSALGWVAGGCTGDSVAPHHGTARDVTGLWAEDFGQGAVPGNSYTMGLSYSAGAVAGNGFYRGEAGPFGSLTIYGTAQADSVHLTIVTQSTSNPQLSPDTARFEAVLTTRDRIDGTVFPSGASYQLSLVRQPGDPH